MIRKSCARSGCRVLVSVGTVYCDEHDAEYRRARWARADAARADQPWRRWYKTAAWQRRRAALFAAEPLCRMCAASGLTVAATVADHVIPHRGNRHLFFHGELQPLCKTCHDVTKQAEERAKAGAGRILGAGP